MLVLTVKQAAKELCCGEQYIRKLNKAGLLKFINLGGLKVRKVTLEIFLEKYDGWDLSDPFNPVAPSEQE